MKWKFGYESFGSLLLIQLKQFKTYEFFSGRKSAGEKDWQSESEVKILPAIVITTVEFSLFQKAFVFERTMADAALRAVLMPRTIANHQQKLIVDDIVASGAKFHDWRFFVSYHTNIIIIISTLDLHLRKLNSMFKCVQVC